MFTKSSKENGKEPAAPKIVSPPSLLSSDLKIIGNLHSDGEIQVDGQVEGDMHCDVLIVGETAKVHGEINADSVRVHGSVTGQISSRSVSLAKSAHVLGDILHENLAIEQGAILEGHCRRIETNKKSSEGAFNLLVKGGAKNKTEQPPKKQFIEPAKA